MTMSNNIVGQFGDTTLTKVFVGGLAWETPKDTMREHFEKYGEILEAVIISDKITGRSKGYGFVSLHHFHCISDEYVFILIVATALLMLASVLARSRLRRLIRQRKLVRMLHPSSMAAVPTAIWLPLVHAALGLQRRPILNSKV